MAYWSDNLKKLTRKEAYPGAMMKNLDGRDGMMSDRSENGIKIVGVKFEKYFPVPTDKVIAEYPNVEAMIDDGWAID
ncbi:MAG: hypothetical protein J6W76_04655 [Spirochaetales bacterium]|nr:hypothetical protein [Spirochaetales bacterium]